MLDEVARTGEPMDIDRNGVKLRIIAVEPKSQSRLARLQLNKPTESVWEGDKQDIFKIDWTEGWESKWNRG
jgi:hypothetical protein